MSREALSLEISQLVARVVNGEAIDTAERGEALAVKYPGLGMSGRQIGQAIDRAAGMVGMIREAPEPPKPQREFVSIAANAAPEPPAPRPEPRNGKAPLSAPMPLPVAAKLIDDELAAAIDAEIGSLVSGHATGSKSAGRRGAANGSVNGTASETAAPPPPSLPDFDFDLTAAHKDAEMDTKGDTGSRPKGRVAAFRRALFGI